MSYFENINIDITEDKIKLTYVSFDTVPEIKKIPKSGFTVTRSDSQSVEEFKEEAFKLLLENIVKIKEGSFKETLKTSLQKQSD